MTCPSLLRRTVVGGVREGHPAAREALQRFRQHSAGRRRHLRQDETAGAQLTRFALVGGVSSALYALAFIALQAAGDQAANLAGAIASTLLANEMHRRLTFHAGERVSAFTAQWEGGGLAVVGLIATSLTLVGVHALIGDVGTVAQLGLIAAVTGAIGLVRFVALRSWVFAAAPAD